MRSAAPKTVDPRAASINSDQEGDGNYVRFEDEADPESQVPAPIGDDEEDHAADGRVVVAREDKGCCKGCCDCGRRVVKGLQESNLVKLGTGAISGFPSGYSFIMYMPQIWEKVFKKHYPLEKENVYLGVGVGLLVATLVATSAVTLPKIGRGIKSLGRKMKRATMAVGHAAGSAVSSTYGFFASPAPQDRVIIEGDRVPLQVLAEIQAAERKEDRSSSVSSLSDIRIDGDREEAKHAVQSTTSDVAIADNLAASLEEALSSGKPMNQQILSKIVGEHQGAIAKLFAGQTSLHTAHDRLTRALVEVGKKAGVEDVFAGIPVLPRVPQKLRTISITGSPGFSSAAGSSATSASSSSSASFSSPSAASARAASSIPPVPGVR